MFSLILIGGLVLAGLYLANGSHSARLEVAELQTRVATLKRELTRRRR